MLVWSFFGLLSVLLSVLCLYFVDVFIEKKDISLAKKIILGVICVPAIFFTPTVHNLGGFNLISCDCSGFEEKYFTNYYYAVGFLVFIWILILGIYKFMKVSKDFRSQILLLVSGVELFLFSFFLTGFLASYLANKGLIGDFGLEFYGLFGMAFFMGMLAFMIVKFKTFHIKLLGVQALVVTLVVLIGSQFAFIRNNTNK
ncbi:MAG: hypothetical protein WAV73_03790, partial [Candidatus Moraniibacteriota bacterium]